MAALSMHSSEVGPTQSLPLLVHELATTDDPGVLARLEEVVLMIVPCHNPDGMDMVVEHYRQTRGGRHDGSTLPGVYHRYVGHDNNRDFVALTQADTRVVNRLYSTEWHPQVAVEKHQMGSSGPRYFVPSSHDPIAENVDEGLWSWAAVFGAHLVHDLTAEGLQGVASHWMFDDYWPGSTTTSVWKNVISFLTEAASCRVASPIFVEPTELSGGGKGLAEYKKGVNLLAPWPGGWWRLGDIVRYELASMRSILATAAANRERILRFRHRMAVLETERGRTVAPYYYVLPSAQHDRGALASLVALLTEHGVEVRRLEKDVVVEGRAYPAGSVVVPLAQPFRAFVKEVMEDQRYPERHYTPDGELIEPYDITSWSLPRHRGLACHEVRTRSAELEGALEPVTAEELQPPSPEIGAGVRALVWPAADDAAHAVAWRALGRGLTVARTTAATEVDGVTLDAGSFVVRGSAVDLAALAGGAPLPPAAVLTGELEAATVSLRRPRVALVETWFHDMDAGWTRWVLDEAGIPFTVLRPGDVAKTELARDFDVVLFPNAPAEVLREGKRKRGDDYWWADYPPEYTRPLGVDGMRRLAAFVDGGGVVVSWGGSTALFLDEFEVSRGGGETESVRLPVHDVTERLVAGGLDVPGSFLAVEVLADHPVTWGLPRMTGIFSRGEPVFATRVPSGDTDRRVLATHPETGILVSGYAARPELLGNRPVAVWTRLGRGQVVLFGFSPQFRGSTPATFKLLFNSLLLPSVAPARGGGR